MLKRAILYAWRKPWLTRFGRTALCAPVIGPALRRVERRLLPQGNRVWVRLDSGLAKGLWLQVDPYREQEYLRGTAETEVQEALAAHLKPDGCFFDVGAHIGVYSLVASRLVGPKGRVVAFEPDPLNAQLMREHAARNGLSNITVAQMAVWRSEGDVSFRRGGDQPMGKSSRRGSVVDSGLAMDSGETISVQAVSLDAFAADNHSPAVIKIDVEGAECEVLDGATGLLASAKPTLICEVHTAEAAAFIEEFLPARDYTIEWVPLRYAFPFPRHFVAAPRQR
ncbi:MAG TPA: FkbM family methyltransferase [Terriglobia bacterium]|nr:FkbM family methyltransferase [Terriglobia bacterium]